MTGARRASATTTRKTARPIHDVAFVLNARVSCCNAYEDGAAATVAVSAVICEPPWRCAPSPRGAAIRAWDGPARSWAFHPRVDESVREIGQQVHEDDDERVDDHHALQHCVVALVERADHQLAEPRSVEHDLGQHRIADQDAEIKTDDGDHGNESVAESVAPDHGACRHATRRDLAP